MSTTAQISNKPPVVYPESDGLPLADNTKQFRLIMTIKGCLDAQYANDPNVFVAGNLLWYPVEGDNKTRAAPDALVAFGRPKGDRGSYMQWLEGNVPPQVVFEIVSPSNRAGMLTEKFDFYNEFGVEEYYLYDPDDNSLDGWQRKGGRLKKIKQMNGWISPLLSIRFSLEDDDLHIYGPSGERFVDTAGALKQRDEANKQRDEANKQRDEVLASRTEAEQRVEKLAAQLKALGINPEA
jgi:Uma2 family endonuclease